MKRTFEPVQISTSEAILLQQIHEDGGEDMHFLSHQLGLSKGKVIALVSNLKQKGLLIINHDYQGTWIKLSRKGSMLINYLWPESQLRGI